VTRRSEDELRAAFAAKAAEAPRADEMLRTVRRDVTKRPSRRRWLVPAAAVAAAAAVAVPLAVGLSSEHGGNAAQRGQAAAGSAASSGEKVPAPAAAGSGGGLCRPTDVTVAVRQTTTGATLTVTSRGAPCSLARVPQVVWPSSEYDARSQGAGLPPSDSATAPRGTLRGGATATATVTWAGRCPPSDDVVRVDWGAGPVQVRTTPATANCPMMGGGPPPHVGAFAGLS
jgi:hypothetical protein